MERLPLSGLYKLQDAVTRAVSPLDGTAHVHVDERARRVVVTTSVHNVAVADAIGRLRTWGPIRYAEDRRLASSRSR